MYIEAFTCAKDPRRPEDNEDRVVAYAGRTFAVLDGVTDKSGERHDGHTGGVHAGHALEAALRATTDDDALADAPLPTLLARWNAAIEAAYERYGLRERAAADPNLRFAAAAAIAHVQGDHVRLVLVGDCGARIDGRPVEHRPHPVDGAVAALRAAAFAALSDLAPDAPLERRLEVARAYAVHGLSSLPPEPWGASGLHEQVVARVEEATSDAFGAMPVAFADAVRAGGLRAVARLRRRDADGGSALARAGLDFGVLDGFELPATLVREARVATADLSVLELFSDGYFGWPRGFGRVADWEAHHAHVERVDPHRVHAYRSTKGSAPGRYADDRSILILRKEPPTA